MKQLFILITSLLCTLIHSQKENFVDPKGKWYFGAETGANIIKEYSVDKTDVSLQGGLLAEYYFAQQFSFSGKIKYFKTGLGFYSPNTHSGSFFDLGHDEFYGTFRGAVISIPLYVKWEFRVYKNLKANLKVGAAYNFETQSIYDYSTNLKTNYPTSYSTAISGLGLNYFVDKRLAIFLDYENYVGSPKKGDSQTIIFDYGYRTRNMLLNFGAKYNFQK